MMEYTTPPSYGSTVVNVGAVAKDGEIIYAGATNSATHLDSLQDSENDWPEPKSVRFIWDGKTKDDSSFHAELEGSLGKRLDRIDIMAEVPGFVKAVVGSVAGTRPYIYQVCFLTIYPAGKLVPLQRFADLSAVLPTRQTHP
jgi:Svf1-like protein